jgi:hypothetical protein
MPLMVTPMRDEVSETRSANLETLTARADAEARRIARDYVAHYGRKRGLFLLGRLLGSERRASAIHYGEAARITAGEYLALREADHALRRQQRDQLRARLNDLDKMLGDEDGAESVLDFGAALAATRSAR